MTTHLVSKSSLGLMAAALTGIQVGAAIFVTRLIVGDIGPMTLAFLRYALAVGCIVPIYLVRPRVSIPLHDVAAIMALGIVQFAALVGLLNLGLETVSAGRAAVLFAVFPVFALLTGWVMKREPFDLFRATGVSISVLAVFLILSGQFGRSGTDGMIGSLAILAAAFCGGVSAAIYRPFLARYPTIQVGVLAMTAAALVLFPFAWAEGGWYGVVEVKTWAGVAFIGFSSAVGFLLWLTALKLTDASQAATLLNLSPIVALFLGWFFLEELVQTSLWTGLLLMGLGIGLVLRPASP